MLECVVNVSEGRDAAKVQAIAAATGDCLLDMHVDADHHRAVLTLGGDEVETAARAMTRVAVATLDLRLHAGVHPRIGVVDVVPFVPLEGSDLTAALAARDAFAAWAGSELDVPCFLYGPERSLPEVRRGAFTTIAPDAGPAAPHPTAGACAVGARDVLVAYNLWLRTHDVGTAKAIAAAVRSPVVRALGLAVGTAVQVSCNLLAPAEVGPAQIYDQVKAAAVIDRAELVGLVPRAVLHEIPRARWPVLDLAEDRTIEARLFGRARW